MDRATLTVRARRNSPMRIRCSGSPTPSAATAACDDFGLQLLGWNKGVSGHMMKRIWLGIFTAGLFNLGTAGATPLITDDEAKLPPPKGAISANTRGILRGPKVEVISPNEAAHS